MKKINWALMPKISEKEIEAVCNEIERKYNTFNEHQKESADLVLGALDAVNDEIESCKKNHDLGEYLESIISAICGYGYSDIALLDLENEIDTSAVEEFIQDVLENQEYGITKVDLEAGKRIPYKRGLRRNDAEEEVIRLNGKSGRKEIYLHEPFEESRSRRGRMLKEGGIPTSVKRKFIDAEGRNKRYSKRYELVNKAKILGATEIETYEEYREIDHDVWLTKLAYSMDMNGNRNGILWYGEKDGKYYYTKSYDVGGRASY